MALPYLQKNNATQTLHSSVGIWSWWKRMLCGETWMHCEDQNGFVGLCNIPVNKGSKRKQFITIPKNFKEGWLNCTNSIREKQCFTALFVHDTPGFSWPLICIPLSTLTLPSIWFNVYGRFFWPMCETTHSDGLASCMLINFLHWPLLCLILL